jgi:carbon-monoxide dehydrogenase large subunit
VVNSVIDALRPLGIRDITMPCTPERVWRAIQAARGAQQASAAEQHEARQSNQTQGNSPQGMVADSDDAQQTGGAA